MYIASYLNFIITLSLVILAAWPTNCAFATRDNLMQSIEISIGGAKVQSSRMLVAAENIANEHSTSTIPGGEPYRRKIVIAKNSYDKKKSANIVRVLKYGRDKSRLTKKYDPGNPGADLNGYVLQPNVSRTIEVADASEAQRGYEANLGMIEVSRSMIQKTIDIIK